MADQHSICAMLKHFTTKTLLIVAFLASTNDIIRLSVKALSEKQLRQDEGNDVNIAVQSSATAAAASATASQTSGSTASSTSSSAESSSSGSSGGAVSDSDFKNAVTALGKPDAASKSSNFMTALKDAAITSKREAAMFLAQVWHESGALAYKEEIACTGSDAKAAACGAAYPIKRNGIKGKYYYGRGYIQLTWDTNYEDASKDLLGDGKQLLQNPEKVATDETLAWRTAAWFWKTNVHSAAGVQSGKFGATTKVINGQLECAKGATTDLSKPKKRFEYYKTILKAFGDSSTPDESGCYS